MKQHEKFQLLERIEQFWPSIFRNKEAVMQEFSKRLEPHSFEVGAKAINQLIETKKVGVPSVAELMEALPTLQKQVVLNECKKCDGSGWIFVNNDSVVDCECSPRSEEVKASDKPYRTKTMTASRMPETIDDAKAKFAQAFKESNVEASDDQIEAFFANKISNNQESEIF
jgi:hypothetical protein